MERIIFFPYHPDLKTVINHKDALRDYEIIGFISFKEDKSLVHALNQALELEDMPYDKLLHDCDAIILLDYKADKYYQVIEDAVGHQKEIFITPLAQSQLDLDKYREQYQLLELLPDDMEDIKEEFERRQEIMLHDIDVPVVGVIGQGKHCDKFENQLLLKHVLEQEYETITVTSNALGVLFGCYTIPSFLYENRSFPEKVAKFNYYIKKISKQGIPDVIVLGIPEGIMPFERHEFHHFAEYPLIASNALSIDIALLCTYFMHGPKLEYGLGKLIEFCQNKFDIPIGAIAISRTAFEIPDEAEKIFFEFLDEPYLSKYYPDLRSINLPMINLLNREEAEAAIKMSIKSLQVNVRAI